MIDLHSHILPGVDDGAADLEESVAMCRQAAAGGCRAMIATPHLRHPSWPENRRGQLEATFEQVSVAVGGELEVHLGAEVRVDSELLGELDGGAAGECLPLAGSRYLLLELPRVEVGPDPEELLHELVVAGWFPVLAHPELIPYLAHDLERLAELVSLGALTQVTAMSVTGEFGRGPKDQVWSMLQAGLVHFVASDCHSSEWRPPGLTEARQRLADRLGEALACQLTETNPARVLSDEPLEAPETA